MNYTFNPEIEKIGEFPSVASIGEIAEEVGMYSASPEFVKENGGKLTQLMMNQVPESFYEECKLLGLYPNIDVRVHRLYPGDFPAVPGWHTDGEFRKNYYSQPDLDKFTQHSHIVGSISTDDNGVSMTELVNEDFEAHIENPDADNTLWQQVHEQIELNKPGIIQLPDGQLTKIGAMTLHRATPARIRGWRLFVRLSMWHKPYISEAGGNIAKQEYVYRLSESKGW